MNRLASVVARYPAPFSPRPYLPAPAFAAPAFAAIEEEPDGDPLADLKMFATGWLGGLIFFGTLFA